MRGNEGGEQSWTGTRKSDDERGVKEGNGLTKREVCFKGCQTVFHIVHVNIQAGHVQSKMFPKMVCACSHTTGGQGCKTKQNM